MGMVSAVQLEKGPRPFPSGKEGGPTHPWVDHRTAGLSDGGRSNPIAGFVKNPLWIAEESVSVGKDRLSPRRIRRARWRNQPVFGHRAV